jgi:WXG100 family type VII secretion target
MGWTQDRVGSRPKGKKMTSGSGITVTYSELETLSSNLNTAMQNLAETIGRIQKCVDAVAGVSWTGTSATAFQQVHEKWNVSANQIQQAVGGLGQFISQARTAFSDTDTGLAKGLGN